MLDVFGNCVTVVNFFGHAKELTFTSTIRILHFPTRALDFPIAAHAEHYPFSYDTEEMPISCARSNASIPIATTCCTAGQGSS